jgi:NhaP-type Na+/H+ or K+/H+ antiporter
MGRQMESEKHEKIEARRGKKEKERKKERTKKKMTLTSANAIFTLYYLSISALQYNIIGRHTVVFDVNELICFTMIAGLN